MADYTRKEIARLAAIKKRINSKMESLGSSLENEQGFLGDSVDAVQHGLLSGAADLTDGIGYLTGSDTIRKGADYLRGQANNQINQMSPDGRDAFQVFGIQADESSPTGYGFKDESSLKGFGLNVLSGVGSFVPTMIPGGIAAKGISAAGKVAGAAGKGVKVEKAIDKASDVVGFGGVGALSIGGSTGNQAYETVANADFHTLKDAEIFQKEYWNLRKLKELDHVSALKQARENVARELATEAAKDGAIMGAITQGALGPVMGKLFRGEAGGIGKAAATGAITEGSQEFVESGGQTAISNMAVNPAVPTNTMDNVIGDALTGAVVGGPVGGGFGAAGASFSRFRKPKDNTDDPLNLSEQDQGYQAVEQQLAEIEGLMVENGDNLTESEFAELEAKRNELLQRRAELTGEQPMDFSGPVESQAQPEPLALPNQNIIYGERPAPSQEQIQARQKSQAAFEGQFGEPRNTGREGEYLGQVFPESANQQQGGNVYDGEVLRDPLPLEAPQQSGDVPALEDAGIIYGEKPESNTRPARSDGLIDPYTAPQPSRKNDNPIYQEIKRKQRLLEEQEQSVTEEAAPQLNQQAAPEAPLEKSALQNEVSESKNVTELPAVESSPVTQPPLEGIVAEQEQSSSAELSTEGSEPIKQALDKAAQDTNTQPTEKQIEADNYKKGRVSLHGLDIAIENPKDSVRSGQDNDGKKWESKMAHHYGDIKGIKGADGDDLDVFIGDKPESDKAYIVDQVDPKTGEFDEHKVMLGFDDKAQAENGYLANYEDGWKGFGAITEMPVSDFKEWIKKGDTTKPLSDLMGNEAELTEQTPIKMSLSNRPFKTESSARLSRTFKDTPNAEIIPVEGGFGVREGNGKDEPLEALRAIQPSNISIEDTLGKWSTLKELRLKAKEYARNHIAGKTVKNNETGRDIVLSMSGIKHTIQGANEDLLLTIPKTEELIKNAKYVGRSQDKKGNKSVIAHHYFEYPLLVRGKRLQVRIDVREMSDGSFYYDHGFKKNESSDGNSSGLNLRSQGPSSKSKPTSEGAEDLRSIDDDGSNANDKEITITENKPKNQAEKIEDVGEKIGGARKDTWGDYLEQINNDLDVSAEPLSKSFPQVDYQKALDGGSDKTALAFVALLRDTIPSKPKAPHKINRWATQVKKAKEAVGFILENPSELESQISKIDSSSTIPHIKHMIDVIKNVPTEKIKEAAAYRISTHHFSSLNGVNYDPPKVFYRVYKNAARKETSLPLESVEEAKKEILKRLDETKAKAKVNQKLEVYKDRYTKQVFVGWKGSTGVLRVKNFDSLSDARIAIAEQRESLESLLSEIKSTPSMRESINANRVGPARRDKDISANEFMEEFGFRGVEFGNYVEQAKRQSDINNAFDGLHDLSELLGIPSKALSLNGALGIAFGARGKGGKNTASAHYEVGNVVINLTKNSGSGSLAHEWWHAMDNYFANQGEAQSDFETDGTRHKKVGDDAEGIRPEVIEAFRNVMSAIKDTDLESRSSLLDETRSKKYWSTKVEMSARTFEAYVKSKLEDKSQSNDYLANIRSEESWGKLKSKDSYPYPKSSEMKGITKAFDQMFQVLKTKETDKGVALFSVGNSNGSGSKADDIRKAVEPLIKQLHEENTFQVVQSVNDLPFAVRILVKKQLSKSKGENATVRGVNAGAKNYLIADGIKDEKEAVSIFLHEVVGHKAVLDMLGKEGDSIMERIAYSYGPKQLQDLIKAYGADFKTKEGRILLGKEKVAQMAENNEKPSLLGKLVANVKAWLRKFFPNIKWSDNDVLNMLATARDKVENRYMVKVDLDPAESKSDAVEKEVNLSVKVKNKTEPTEETPYDTLYRTLGQKDKTVFQKAKDEMKRQFKAGGLLPDSVFNKKIARDSDMNASELEISAYLSSFRSSIKKAYGKDYSDLSDALKQKLNNQMSSTDPDKTIPFSVRLELMKMRFSIKGLSQEYAAILKSDMEQLRNEGRDSAANEKAQLLETILGNLDTYTNRSYKAFDDPKWPKKVPQNILDDAKNYLESRYEGQGLPKSEIQTAVARTIRTILEEGTAYEDMGSFIKESKLGAKDLSTLKKRKEIAPEIRALLGEYQDVEVNFAKTVTKTSHLVANHKFLQHVRDLGEKEGFLFTEENRPLDKSVVKIAADGSEVMAPLNGFYTYPEIEQAFREALGKQGDMPTWLSGIIRLNGIVKYGKTVLSPTTAMRNIWSAFFFSVANGHFDIGQMRKSIEVRKQYFGGDNDKSKLAYLKKLKSLGVIYDTPYAGEMMDLLEDSRLQDFMTNKKVFSSFTKLNDFAQKFYQYGDDMWKIMGWENEKAMLMKYKKMSESDAEVAAAERIRNTYPTYSMTGRFTQSLRRFPLAGTFVSFPAEIIRTSYHMINYLKQDFKESPAYARRKLAGLALVSSLGFAAQGISKALMGLDDDEEEAVRDMAAPWQKNSNILFTGRDENGNIQYLDMSFLDPYNYFKRPINAMLRDQPIQDMVAQSASEMLTPFFGEDITFSNLMEVYTNKKGSGGKVFNEQASTSDQTVDIANHLRKGLQPGFMSNMERMYKAMEGDVSASGKKYTVQDEMAALVGFRMSTLDPKTALYYQSFDFKQNKADSAKILKDVLRNPNKVSKSDLENARDMMLKARKDSYDRMMRLVKSAKKAGMTNPEIGQILKLSGVSRQDVMSLILGRMPKNDSYLKMAASISKRAEVLYGKESGNEIISRAKGL
ncbi:hypothetical protein C0J08_14915 [Marinomonas sp. CT5]|uniref:LPD3 domain-containing protein n=1 Tax=Marinomonas sp. CT5 TaxID=2066133 RepID=UPI001BAFB268|nr:LPD5 domain-containing protein [Marinomonas sp. CT5]QUX96610.1 hypothetical protein C0J08_14915 [Marinomonas sp. CT5]